MVIRENLIPSPLLVQGIGFLATSQVTWTPSGGMGRRSVCHRDFGHRSKPSATGFMEGPMENVPFASKLADCRAQGTHQPMLLYRFVPTIEHVDFLLSYASCCIYLYQLVIKVSQPVLLIISLFHLRFRLRSLHIFTPSVDYCRLNFIHIHSIKYILLVQPTDSEPQRTMHFSSAVKSFILISIHCQGIIGLQIFNCPDPKTPVGLCRRATKLDANSEPLSFAG